MSSVFSEKGYTEELLEKSVCSIFVCLRSIPTRVIFNEFATKKKYVSLHNFVTPKGSIHLFLFFSLFRCTDGAVALPSRQDFK